MLPPKPKCVNLDKNCSGVSSSSLAGRLIDTLCDRVNEGLGLGDFLPWGNGDGE